MEKKVVDMTLAEYVEYVGNDSKKMKRDEFFAVHEKAGIAIDIIEEEWNLMFPPNGEVFVDRVID